MKKSGSAKRLNLDFTMILATVAVLFMVSALCIGSMFYFKAAGLDSATPAAKMAYQAKMNSMLIPLLVALLLVMAICIPRRIIKPKWITYTAFSLAAIFVYTVFAIDLTAGLVAVAVVSLLFQVWVLISTMLGKKLNYRFEGYWSRLGSALFHLGFVLFCLDFLTLRYLDLHMIIFWSSFLFMVAGMVMLFYSDLVIKLVNRVERDR